FRANSGTTLNISGATFGDSLSSTPGSNVRIFDGEFRLNGLPIGGLTTPGDSLSIDIPVGSALTGILANGTPFAFSSLDRFTTLANGDEFAVGTLTLELTALPAVNQISITPSETNSLGGLRQGQALTMPSGTVRNNIGAG